MRKDPKEVHTGLIAWREYGRCLTRDEVALQVRNYGDEGFDYVAERNSETILVFCTNDGLAFHEKRLRALHLSWHRSPYRFSQLRAKALGMMGEMGRDSRVRTRVHAWKAVAAAAAEVR